MQGSNTLKRPNLSAIWILSTWYTRHATGNQGNINTMNKRFSVHWVGNTVSWSNIRSKSNRIRPWRWIQSSFLFHGLYVICRPLFVQVIWTELAALFRETTLRQIHRPRQEVLVNRKNRPTETYGQWNVLVTWTKEKKGPFWWAVRKKKIRVLKLS